MKIGILTLPLHTNYGGILQAYALQTVLERMGHEVCLIDKRWKPIPWGICDRIWFRVKLFIKRILNRPCYQDYRHPSIYPHVSINTQLFINKHIKQKHIDKWNDLNEREFDAIIVGGDQIWRPMYLPFLMDSKPDNVYLNFASGWDIKRISYAPSFGTGDWEYSDRETLECSALLKMFDAVSVREASGVEMIQEHFGVNAEHVLDPTLLLEKEDYIKLCESTPKSLGSLLTYILDSNDSISSFIETVATKSGLKSFTVNSKVENPRASLSDRIQPSVEKWLRGFYDAQFVITDSFHACIFSMIFNKPFVVIGNKGRGLARFESFLSMFDQKERLITDLSNTSLQHLINTAPGVDFSSLRNKSINYLNCALQ